MNILLLKENKNENRVALLPDDVREIIRNKNTIFVQKNYGIKNFISDEEYKNASATIFDNLNNIAKDIDVVVKIGELSKKEAKLLQGKILISNLNLSNNPKNLNLILRNNITSIALEEIDTDNHNYNFYQCNEQLKGRFAALVSSYYLGKVIPFAIGKTFSPIPYCKTHAHYTIMNCGEAGIAAAKVILSFGGKVTFLEEDEEVWEKVKKNKELNTLVALYDNNVVNIVKASFQNIERILPYTEVLIITNKIVGSKSNCRITKKMISTMPKGSIVVDVSVDQGLGTESLKKPTTLKKPYVIVDDVIHIAIENIASLYPITMSQFFSSVVTEHIIKSKGDFANYIDKEIKKSLQTKDGKIFNKKISDSLNLKFK